MRFEKYIAVAGWGRTVGGGSAADTLQQAMLPVAEHSACSRVNGRLGRVDEKSMVCAGGQGKGGCQVKNLTKINKNFTTSLCLVLFSFVFSSSILFASDNNSNKTMQQRGETCYVVGFRRKYWPIISENVLD